MRYVQGLLRQGDDELEKIGGRRTWAKRVEMVEGMMQEEGDGEGEGGGVVWSSTEARAAVRDKDWERLKRLVPEGVAQSVERGEVSW